MVKYQNHYGHKKQYVPNGFKPPVQSIENATTGKIISKFTYDASNVAHSLGNIITIIVKDTLLVLDCYLIYFSSTGN